MAFQPESRLWLRGEGSQPMAYIDAAIFGNEGHYGYPEFTAEVTRALGDVLGIRSLPTCLIQHKDKALLMQSFAYEDYVDAMKGL